MRCRPGISGARAKTIAVAALMIAMLTNPVPAQETPAVKDTIFARKRAADFKPLIVRLRERCNACHELNLKTD
jgi:hypothetical protein